MTKVKNISKVAGSMPVADPFIVGAYHNDKYPKANGNMGPDAPLTGHNIGNDFGRELEWRMYYGEKIPGFPHHPHRGFEIVTIVPEGYADHFDSKGSKGRYGQGDVQLMSAGSGVLHGEMFPLLNDEAENPFRLFQIWLNLPAKSKLTEPDYKMLWAENIPEAKVTDINGNNTTIKVILGTYAGVKSIAPLTNSWANDPNHHVGVALADLGPNAEFKLPAVSGTMNRSVFFYDGNSTLKVEGYAMQSGFFADLNGGEEITFKNGNESAKLLILEGEPIGEPVAARGPFVMNTEQELQAAYAEYRQTQFGGWPWGTTEMDLVNPKDAGRFASYHFGKETDVPPAKHG
jgi:redox-sensitive bicupin YhaK (pirin superfamily)